MPALVSLGQPAAPLVSVAEAAGYLNVNPCTVRRMIARGALKATRIGPRVLRIDPTDLSALVNGDVR